MWMLIGAIFGPGVSVPPAPAAAVGFLACLAMILKGVRMIWIAVGRSTTHSAASELC
jgi:hypothetical protein